MPYSSNTRPRPSRPTRDFTAKWTHRGKESHRECWIFGVMHCSSLPRVRAPLSDASCLRCMKADAVLFYPSRSICCIYPLPSLARTFALSSDTKTYPHHHKYSQMHHRHPTPHSKRHRAGRSALPSPRPTSSLLEHRNDNARSLHAQHGLTHPPHRRPHPPLRNVPRRPHPHALRRPHHSCHISCTKSKGVEGILGKCG